MTVWRALAPSSPCSNARALPPEALIVSVDFVERGSAAQSEQVNLQLASSTATLTLPPLALHAGTHSKDVSVICSDIDPRVKPRGALGRKPSGSHSLQALCAATDPPVRPESTQCMGAALRFHTHAVPVRLEGTKRTRRLAQGSVVLNAGRLGVQYGGVWGTVSGSRGMSTAVPTGGCVRINSCWQGCCLLPAGSQKGAAASNLYNCRCATTSFQMLRRRWHAGARASKGGASSYAPGWSMEALVQVPGRSCSTKWSSWAMKPRWTTADTRAGVCTTGASLWVVQTCMSLWAEQAA